MFSLNTPTKQVAMGDPVSPSGLPSRTESRLELSRQYIDHFKESLHNQLKRSLDLFKKLSPHGLNIHEVASRIAEKIPGKIINDLGGSPVDMLERESRGQAGRQDMFHRASSITVPDTRKPNVRPPNNPDHGQKNENERGTFAGQLLSALGLGPKKLQPTTGDSAPSLNTSIFEDPQTTGMGITPDGRHRSLNPSTTTFRAKVRAAQFEIPRLSNQRNLKGMQGALPVSVIQNLPGNRRPAFGGRRT